MSNVSSWQIPASGQAVTLRTTLPHASRVVIPDGGEPAHEGRRVVDVHVVKLDILARRDVRHAVGIFLGKIRQSFQLLRRDAAERNLDAHHARRIPKSFRPFDHLAGISVFAHA